MLCLADEELRSAKETIARTEEELRVLLLPRDENDDKNVIVEIRAGAGGEEAALFAGDLYRMYSMYADSMGWKHELMSANERPDSAAFERYLFSSRERALIRD